MFKGTDVLSLSDADREYNLIKFTILNVQSDGVSM